MNIQIVTDNKSIEGGSDDALRIRISNVKNNGISIDENGLLIAVKGEPGKTGSTGTMNIPGNSIDGDVNTGISVLRLNSSVSRRKLGDNPDNEGVLMSDVITNILNN